MKINIHLKLSNSVPTAFLAFGMCALQACAQTTEAAPALIPQPNFLEMRTGSLLVSDSTPVMFPTGDKAAAFAAQHLAWLAG